MRDPLTPSQRFYSLPCSHRKAVQAVKYSGGVAQLGERVNGIHEVRGSIPLASIFCCTMVGNGGIVVWDGPGYFAGPIVGNAGIAQLVEHNLAKVGVAGSSPVSRSSCHGSRREPLMETVGLASAAKLAISTRGGAVW